VPLFKYRTAKNSKLSALRYQKRATNQLIKGVKAVAKDEDLYVLQNEVIFWHLLLFYSAVQGATI